MIRVVTLRNLERVAAWAGADGIWEVGSPEPCVWLNDSTVRALPGDVLIRWGGSVRVWSWRSTQLGWLLFALAALLVAGFGIAEVGGPLGAFVALLMAGCASVAAYLAGRTTS